MKSLEHLDNIIDYGNGNTEYYNGEKHFSLSENNPANVNVNKSCSWINGQNDHHMFALFS